MGKQAPVPITGLWLREINDEAQVLVEINGEWRLVAQEPCRDGTFSCIYEPLGILASPLDSVTTPPKGE